MDYKKTIKKEGRTIKMLKKYKEWAIDDLKDILEEIEERENKLHIEASLTTTKIRSKENRIEFNFTAIFERDI